MSTNQMRREAAKRKLARQRERQVAQAKRRRQLSVIGSIVAVVVVVVGVVLFATLGGGSGSTTAGAAATPAPDSEAPSPATAAAQTPGSCNYAAAGSAAKPNELPKTSGVATDGTPKVNLATSAGPIGLTLETAKAPCTVNSFLSLASQQYFDGTVCHRLTTGAGLKVLQCGDPSGQGTGGPGYTVPDENPKDLAPAANGTAVYPRGTVAMANTGQPDSGGSQFFLVYADSTLPPNYAVFGTIDPAGLATLDKIAAAGDDSANGPGDGHPKTPVTITSVTAA